jgi:gamma-glutamylaminecyclotransferase
MTEATGCEALGEHRTVERYPMLIAGPRFAPMMLHEPGVGLHVLGELYEVEDRQLVSLDALESVGTPGNFRILVQLEAVDRSCRSWAYAFMKGRELAIPIHSGYLASYNDQRFIPPDQKP